VEAQDIARLRAYLLARQAELLAQGDAVIEPNREDPVAKPDEDAQPLNEMHQVLASRHNRLRAEELSGIADALRRMAERPDEFGVCIDCEEDIPTRRLELMPWVTRCVTCQQKLAGAHRSGRRRHAGDYHQ
jgi:DnaK suppressor protein